MRVCLPYERSHLIRCVYVPARVCACVRICASMCSGQSRDHLWVRSHVHGHTLRPTLCMTED